METSISWITGSREPAVEVYSDDRSWRAKLLKLAAENPDEVIVKERPETNDGAVIIKIPVSFVKISPPRRVSMTDDQRAALADRMRNLARKTQTESVE